MVWKILNNKYFTQGKEIIGSKKQVINCFLPSLWAKRELARAFVGMQ